MDTTKRKAEPPVWYTNLPKWAQALLGLAVLAVACGMCAYGVRFVNQLPDPTPAPTAAPTETIAPEPSATTETTVPAGQASATPSVEAAVTALMEWVGAFNAEAGQVFYRQAGIVDNGTRCRLIVDDAWYGLETYVKERLLEQAAEQCLLAARIYLDKSDITTSLYSVSGKEVAYKSPFRTKINE